MTHPSKSAAALLTVGQLAGVHGVKGWVKVRSFTEDEKDIVDYKPWHLLSAHGCKEIEIDDFRVRPQGLTVHIKGIDDRDVAAQLGRAKIQVPRECMPELAEGEFYHFQLVAMRVYCVHQAEEVLIGEVDHVMVTGANDVLAIKPCAGSLDDRERLVPYVPEIYVLDVDLESASMRVNWDPDF